MPAINVFACSEGGSQNTVTLSTAKYPTCPDGNGQWQAISVSEPFSISDLNPSDLAGAYGAGFVVMATGIVIGQACKAIWRAIF